MRDPRLAEHGRISPGEILNQEARKVEPSGVVTSVPDGGLNSNVDGGIGARVWFEYVVTIRSPFGNNISVRSTRNSLLIRRSSF